MVRDNIQQECWEFDFVGEWICREYQRDEVEGIFCSPEQLKEHWYSVSEL